MGIEVNQDAPKCVQKIGIVGTGVMGSMLSLLFAEYGDVQVSIFDLSIASMEATVQKAKQAGLGDKINICEDLTALCQSLESPKVVMFSLPHGRPGDTVVESLTPYLTDGDIVIDGSNEDYRVTQKRQSRLRSRGVSYVGMGVSGGFAGARDGPSLMPSGDSKALELLMPLLKKIAAKDDQGRPCVAQIGPGGSGHYVKMVHNGIEHGVMSILCEAWSIMASCLSMEGDEIDKVFSVWNKQGELSNNFLVSISGPICRTRSPDGNGYLLHQIRDAVVQDANDSEGTGVWANQEAVLRHVPAPSLTTAHYLRLASANYDLRSSIKDSLGNLASSAVDLTGQEKAAFLENLHKAVYTAVLCCFIQGLDLLSHTSQQEGWNVRLDEILHIWRAGCIIKSDYVTDLFERHYTKFPTRHPLLGDEICSEIKRCLPSMKIIVLQSIGANVCVPSLSASLEYLKYIGSVDLPTCFMEAQLDAFGAHGYELKTEVFGKMTKGKYHSDWSQSKR